MKIFVVLFAAFFSFNAFAEKWEGPCEKEEAKKKKCIPLSGAISAGDPAVEWVIGNVANKPGQCWWTCNETYSSDPAVKPTDGKTSFYKYKPSGVKPEKPKAERCQVTEDEAICGAKKYKRVEDESWRKYMKNPSTGKPMYPGMLPSAKAVETPRDSQEEDGRPVVNGAFRPDK